MKKTININLAGIHFHIDEDAYLKLSNYLDAVRRSLKNAEGSDEIMQDIEARIAELFTEKIDSDKQVISHRELDEVIAVMGQPEDYEMDEDTDDEQATSTQKSGNRKLFRDIDNKYIGGVSSGLGHYLGVDAIWIRLIWILLVVGGFGSPILIYIILWILVPAAVTTSDKLKMMGEPINISNIEKKFKEKYNDVAQGVKNADYDKYGNKIKTGASKFFDGLGDALKVLLVVFSKIIGVIILLISLSLLFSLIAGIVSFGNISFWNQIGFSEYFTLIDMNLIPLWVTSLLFFLVIGIPLFALFVLGLRLLITNLRQMSTTIKVLIFSVWVLAIIGLIVVGTMQSREWNYSSNSVEEVALPVTSGDTLNLAFIGSSLYGLDVYRKSGITIKHNENGEPVMYSNNITLAIRPNNDSIAKLIIDKKAKGNSFPNAKKRAEAVDYDYEMQHNRLRLNGFFTSDMAHKYRDQEMKITLLLPEETILYADKKSSSFISHRSKFPGKTSADAHYYLYTNGAFRCLDCPEIKVTNTVSDSTATESNESWEARVLEKFED